jgi:hypothetical protein
MTHLQGSCLPCDTSVVSSALSCSISVLAAAKSSWRAAVVSLVVSEGPVPLELAPLRGLSGHGAYSSRSWILSS